MEVKSLEISSIQVEPKSNEPRKAARPLIHQPKKDNIKKVEDEFYTKKIATPVNQKETVSHSDPRISASVLIERGELWSGRSKIQEVIPNLCITNFFGAKNASVLAGSNISHIVVCANEISEIFPSKFKYLKLEGLTDNTGTSLDAHIKKALPWVKSAINKGGRVVLHCASGSSRSGSVLIAYLMWEMNISASEALKLAQKHRPIILPNPGFYEQLQALDKKIGNFV